MAGILLLGLLACVDRSGGSVPSGFREGMALEAPTFTEHSDHLVLQPLPDGWEQIGRERWDAERYTFHADSTGGLDARAVDLDGDGLRDQALFLSRTDSVHPDSSYAVFVQWGTGGDTLLGVFSWAEAMGTIGMGLVVEPPGPLLHLGAEDAPDLPSPVELDQPALTLLVFEKAAVTWIWQQGRCHQVWTAD